jgi:hypothetical protein
MNIFLIGISRPDGKAQARRSHPETKGFLCPRMGGGFEMNFEATGNA